MNDHRPNLGDWTLITLHARCIADGLGGTLVYRVEGVSGEALTISSGEDAFVRAEPSPKPALPTAFGSRIVATVGTRDGGERVELVLVDPASGGRWTDQRGRWFGDVDLSDVDVLHDADDPRVPAAPVDPHPAAPEPVALPTELGAVVLTRNSDDEEGYAVHLLGGGAAPGTLSWRFFIPGFPHCTGWMTEEHVAAWFMGRVDIAPGGRP